MSDDYLHQSSVDFAKAGLDQQFTLFKIYTRKLHDSKTAEDGQFSLDCAFPLVELERSVDPVSLLKRLGRLYLNHCVQTTQVPQHMWIIEFSPIMVRYNVPSHLFLDTVRDRTWLL